MSALQRLLSTFLKCKHSFSPVKKKKKKKPDADTLFYQVYHFLGIPKLQMEQHILVLNKTSLNNHSLISAGNYSEDLFYQHLVKEVCASNSSVILQSLHTLPKHNMYITDFIINGKFFINFNTDKFKACAVFMKQ
jgi:hypothetical protein